ncbi:hypothetical protein NHQ30_005193 [Ciborinia camelliae]|nr:hypothetical protein NHQ30_005193 [Ciborinia camelliae]
MPSFIKERYSSISRRFSQVAPILSPSDKTRNTKTQPSNTPKKEVMTQNDRPSLRSRRDQSVGSKSKRNLSTSPKIENVAHDDQKSKGSLKSSQPPSSDSAKSGIIHTPKSNTSTENPSGTNTSGGNTSGGNTSSTNPSDASGTSHSYNTFSSNLSSTAKSNKNGPDEKYQINSHLVFEHLFPGQTFVSVHLQRLQHGIYSDANLHTKHTLHVTFVALSFVFHPSSPSHRFESAVINIKVKDKRGNLRFLKYAPHQAYGRISTQSLKWNFQLGTSLGVTQGPANASVKSSVSEEKDKVVGSMMKIQGSTRSTVSNSTRHPDTLLHFSLEENSQQESGIPREFTFVFMLERPSEKQYPPVHTFHPTSKMKTLEHRIQEKLKGLVGMHDHEQDEEIMKYEYKDLAGGRKTPREFLSKDLEGIFGEVEFDISIDPKISNVLTIPSALNTHPKGESESTTIAGEVGQKFPTEGTADSIGKVEHPEVMVDGLYNFAKLGGLFEDLVCLPGESVGSRVPDVPGMGGGGGGGGGGNGGSGEGSG